MRCVVCKSSDCMLNSLRNSDLVLGTGCHHGRPADWLMCCRMDLVNVSSRNRVGNRMKTVMMAVDGRLRGIWRCAS